LEFQLLRWKQVDNILLKNNKYCEFEELIDLTDFVPNQSFLNKFGEEIKKNDERKKFKKGIQIQKFEKNQYFIDSSFKFFPSVKISKKPSLMCQSDLKSSAISSSSLSPKNISKNLKNRFSFLKGYWNGSGDIIINQTKILYKLHSVIVHSGSFTFIIIFYNEKRRY
jgi:hypothetical protein